MAGPDKSNSRRTLYFKIAHLAEYGFTIAHRDSKTLQVCFIRCQSSVVIHERIIGRNRQTT